MINITIGEIEKINRENRNELLDLFKTITLRMETIIQEKEDTIGHIKFEFKKEEKLEIYEVFYRGRIKVRIIKNI